MSKPTKDTAHAPRDHKAERDAKTPHTRQPGDPHDVAATVDGTADQNAPDAETRNHTEPRDPTVATPSTHDLHDVPRADHGEGKVAADLAKDAPGSLHIGDPDQPISPEDATRAREVGSPFDTPDPDPDPSADGDFLPNPGTRANIRRRTANPITEGPIQDAQGVPIGPSNPPNAIATGLQRPEERSDDPDGFVREWGGDKGVERLIDTMERHAKQTHGLTQDKDFILRIARHLRVLADYPIVDPDAVGANVTTRPVQSGTPTRSQRASQSAPLVEPTAAP